MLLLKVNRLLDFFQINALKIQTASRVILKGGGDILTHQLTRLYRMSFSAGLIPQDWKKSIIFPIKKKTRSLTVDDFRPINITSSKGCSNNLERF